MTWHARETSLAIVLAVGLGLTTTNGAQADDFTFEFSWGDIPRCTSGFPNRVTNPIFSVNNVPAGTTRIDFSLTDLDAPNYNHGGGRAAFSRQAAIQPGAFKYESPCPPNGQHRYRWTARAKSKDGKTLAKAESMQKYP